MKSILRLLAVAALAGGIMVAGEPGGRVSVDKRDRPLAEVVKDIEQATGRKLDFTPATLDGRTLTFVKSGTPEEVFLAFVAALDVTQSIALVPSKDGAWKLVPFTRKPQTSPRPPSRGRRLAVDVVEGTVLLTGGQGNVTVRAGERSWVYSGALPVPPVPVDTTTVAPWRFPDAPAAAGIDASIPLPEIRWRFVGTTEDGKPIVEYEVVGDSRTTEFGTFEAPTVARHRLVIENGVLDLPINFHFTVPKGTNK